MQTNLKPFVNVDGKGALGILSTVAGQKDIRLKKLNASPESEIGLNLLHKDKISLANFAEELFKNIHPKNMGRLPEHVSVSASLNGSLLQIEFKILGGGEDTNFRQCYLSHIANYAKKNGMEFKEGSERAYVLEVQCRPAKEVLTDKLPVDVPKDALTGSKLLEIVRGDKGRHIEIKSLNSGISSDAYGLTIKEFEGFFGKVVNAIEDDGIHVSLVVFRNKDTGGTGISLRSPYGGQFYSALQDKLTTICDEFNVEFYTNDGRFVHQVEFRMPKYGAERKKAQVEALSTEEMLRLIGSICPVTRCDDAARGKEHKISEADFREIIKKMHDKIYEDVTKNFHYHLLEFSVKATITHFSERKITEIILDVKPAISDDLDFALGDIRALAEKNGGWIKSNRRSKVTIAISTVQLEYNAAKVNGGEILEILDKLEPKYKCACQLAGIHGPFYFDKAKFAELMESLFKYSNEHISPGSKIFKVSRFADEDQIQLRFHDMTVYPQDIAQIKEFGKMARRAGLGFDYAEFGVILITLPKYSEPKGTLKDEIENLKQNNPNADLIFRRL